MQIVECDECYESSPIQTKRVIVLVTKDRDATASTVAALVSPKLLLSLKISAIRKRMVVQ